MSDDMLPLDGVPRRQLRNRYADIVRVTVRCCNCGTEFSHAWHPWRDRQVCGDCWGNSEPFS